MRLQGILTAGMLCLLLTTALISVASLNCLPGQAVAQVYLDNVNPGDGAIETESTGFFDTLRQSDAVWTDADGLNASALATDQTGILTGGRPAAGERLVAGAGRESAARQLGVQCRQVNLPRRGQAVDLQVFEPHDSALSENEIPHTVAEA